MLPVGRGKEGGKWGEGSGEREVGGGEWGEGSYKHHMQRKHL